MNLENPGVPTIIIYAASMSTSAKYFYDNDPWEYALEQQFYFSDFVEKQLGDGSILATSSLTAGIKWLYVIFIVKLIKEF